MARASRAEEATGTGFGVVSKTKKAVRADTARMPIIYRRSEDLSTLRIISVQKMVSPHQKVHRSQLEGPSTGQI